MSFTSGAFPSALKVVPVHKNKLDFLNYCLISLLSNLNKILTKS